MPNLEKAMVNFSKLLIAKFKNIYKKYHILNQSDNATFHMRWIMESKWFLKVNIFFKIYFV